MQQAVDASTLSAVVELLAIEHFVDCFSREKIGRHLVTVMKHAIADLQMTDDDQRHVATSSISILNAEL